jgi:hypothetical protein
MGLVKGSKGIFDYYSIADRWSECIGSSIIVRPYDVIMASGIDVVKDFYEYLSKIFDVNVKLPNTIISNKKFLNSSVPDYMVNMIRHFNRKPSKKRIVPVLKRLGFTLRNRSIASKGNLISPSDRRRLLHMYHNQNFLLSSKYLGLDRIWFDETIDETDEDWKKERGFEGADVMRLCRDFNKVLNAQE